MSTDRSGAAAGSAVVDEPGRPVGPIARVRAWIVGHRAFLRYVLVGGFNTLLDIALFTLLAVPVGLPPLVANVCSTVVTMSVSYLLNRLFVFRSDSGVARTVGQFVAVTLTSAFVVQSIVIESVIRLGEWVVPTLDHGVLTSGAKVCATGVGMITNYLGYRWLFRKR